MTQLLEDAALQRVMSVSNWTGNDTFLPKEITFNSDSVVSIAAYSTLFVVSAIGNLAVFTVLYRNRAHHSRVNK